MEPLAGRIPRDQNRVPVLGAISTADGTTVIPLEADPATGALLVEASSGSATLPNVLYNGQLTIGTSASQLPSHSLTQGASIEASINNTANIFVGTSSVTASSTTGGIELPPGSAVTILVRNTNLLYAISTTTGQVITFVGS